QPVLIANACSGPARGRTVPPPGLTSTRSDAASRDSSSKPLHWTVYLPLLRFHRLQDFKTAATGVSAKAMRNELNAMIQKIDDAEYKKVRRGTRLGPRSIYRAVEANEVGEKKVDLAPAFEAEMQSFFILFNRYLTERAQGQKIDWDKIQPPKPEQVVPYADLPPCSDPSLLDKLAVLKLNGGLGTTMGCVGPKSIIEVREGMTFLDLSVRQIEHLNSAHNVNVPFILMNSFNTDEDTARIIQKYSNHRIELMTFNQLTDLPSLPPWTVSLPPCQQGDPSPDPSLRSRGQGCLFLMEVTDKTKADVKGGTLINYEGNVRLLEIAQVPSDHVEDFKSVRKFKIFNTNNLWVNLRAIKRIMENDGMDLEVIVNNKTSDKGEAVIQLETAVGAAIKRSLSSSLSLSAFFQLTKMAFPDTQTSRTHTASMSRDPASCPSSRAPTSCSSPLTFTSLSTASVSPSLFSLLDEGDTDWIALVLPRLKMNPDRMFQSTPVVKLGDAFKKVAAFQKRFKTIPSLLELDHLTVAGDVSFGRGVILRGTVIIVANDGAKIELPDGTTLENKLVSGNLQLTDH
ncbi:SPOSA6832_04869, partial [Sporobolomyces salmonicolor]